jgi:hypothetical protein
MQAGGPSAPVPSDNQPPPRGPAGAPPVRPTVGPGERTSVPAGTAAPPPPPRATPGAGWWVGAAVVALVVGVGGYLIGHNIGQTDERDNFDAGAPGYNDIYQQGFTAGKAAGAQQGQAKGAAQGEQTGLEQGEQQGKQQGEQQGKQQGVAEGTKVGADAALGGFSTWKPGAPYVVKVETGSGSVPYQISSRTLMTADTDYALCKDAPTQVCTVPESSGGSGSSGSSSGSSGSTTSTDSSGSTTSTGSGSTTTSGDSGG